MSKKTKRIVEERIVERSTCFGADESIQLIFRNVEHTHSQNELLDKLSKTVLGQKVEFISAISTISAISVILTVSSTSAAKANK